MPAATQAPPASAPTIQPQSPKPGPSAVPVGAMPAPPTADGSPAPSKPDPFSGFDKYAKSNDKSLVLPGSKNQEPPAHPEAPKPAEPKEPAQPTPDDDDDDLGEPKTAPPAETKPDESKTAPKVDGKDKKVSPWKLVEEHKAARLKAETEVASLRKLVPNETEAKAGQERFKQLEQQNKELLDHLRYIDYQKHPEFLEKYQKPYEGKFNQIMGRLNGAKLQLPDGNTRPVTANDIVKLGSLNAIDLIEESEKMFGKLGPWVAERVEELTQLWNDKEVAREKAKGEGAKMAEQYETQSAEVNKSIKEMYEKSVTEIEQHSKYAKYFKPTEGDEEFNARLEKGTNFVDENWRKDPRDPNLTSEQREKIVKSHAAIRNRARAWSVLNLTIARNEAEIARLTTELAQFKASEPKLDGQRTEQSTNGATSDPLQSIFRGIEKYAKPGF